MRWLKTRGGVPGCVTCKMPHTWHDCPFRLRIVEKRYHQKLRDHADGKLTGLFNAGITGTFQKLPAEVRVIIFSYVFDNSSVAGRIGNEKAASCSGAVLVRPGYFDQVIRYTGLPWGELYDAWLKSKTFKIEHHWAIMEWIRVLRASQKLNHIKAVSRPLHMRITKEPRLTKRPQIKVTNVNEVILSDNIDEHWYSVTKCFPNLRKISLPVSTSQLCPHHQRVPSILTELHIEKLADIKFKNIKGLQLRCCRHWRHDDWLERYVKEDMDALVELVMKKLNEIGRPDVQVFWSWPVDASDGRLVENDGEWDAI